MNHKRGRPKNARSGCLMCKPWKVNGAKHSKENLTKQVILSLIRMKDN